jgi:hypothetical protein
MFFFMGEVVACVCVCVLIYGKLAQSQTEIGSAMIKKPESADFLREISSSNLVEKQQS